MSDPVLWYTGRGNLATRWPRHFIEAVRDASVATPVLEDLIAESKVVEKEGEEAAIPVTAMNLATNKNPLEVYTIRGIGVPAKPAPPGPEGEYCVS
jgi:hypothetical protein